MRTMSTPEATVSCSLYTSSRLRRDRDAFSRLWSLLAAPLVGAERYDSKERPLTRRFAADPTKAFELLSSDQYLYVSGKSDGFALSISYAGSGIHQINIYWHVTAFEGATGASWLDWIFRLVGEIPVLFGSGCSSAEYDAKHESVQVLPDGGRITGWVGSSMADFAKYLPGIYWLTLFGPELGGALDFTKLESLPVTVTTLPGNQVALRVDEPVVPSDMDARLALEARIADALGARFFFDRHRTDLAFAHVPAFHDALERLRQPR